MSAARPAAWPAGPALVLVLAPLVAGCATGSDPRDPLEAINRPVFAFNDALDRHALRPIAVGYRKVTPEPIQLVLGNFFANLGDLYIGVNNLLQAKPRAALIDATRFVVNSTLGLAGVADVASAMGLPRHNEDFGQTLGRWGVPAGPYLMLPFFGPSTLRDAPARYVDSFGDPVVQYHDVPWRNTGYGLRVIDERVQLLDGERLLDGALDRYALIRDGYLQRRRSLIYDGDPPDEDPGYEDDSGYGEEAAGAGAAGAKGTADAAGSGPAR